MAPAASCACRRPRSRGSVRSPVRSRPGGGRPPVRGKSPVLLKAQSSLHEPFWRMHGRQSAVRLNAQLRGILRFCSFFIFPLTSSGGPFASRRRPARKGACAARGKATTVATAPTLFERRSVARRPSHATPGGRATPAYIVVMESTHSLTSLSDDELLRRLSDLLGRSRRNEADLVAHIGEVDARRLYARKPRPRCSLTVPRSSTSPKPRPTSASRPPAPRGSTPSS